MRSGGTSGQQRFDFREKTRPGTQDRSGFDYRDLVQDLYVAYFGRPADSNGLSNFESALLVAGAPTDIQGLVQAYASNSSVKNLIDSFGTSKGITNPLRQQRHQ